QPAGRLVDAGPLTGADGDARALAHERLGDRVAQPGRRGRDGCPLPREAQVHCVGHPNEVVSNVEEVERALAEHGYLADEGLATAIFLALTLRRPLLLEGEAGVGKTEVAKVLARWTGGELLRLQCYEGIDVSQAVYEWDYSRQLLHLRAAEATGGAGSDTGALEDELYSERFLVRRPL